MSYDQINPDNWKTQKVHEFIEKGSIFLGQEVLHSFVSPPLPKGNYKTSLDGWTHLHFFFGSMAPTKEDQLGQRQCIIVEGVVFTDEHPLFKEVFTKGAFSIKEEEPE